MKLLLLLLLTSTTLLAQPTSQQVIKRLTYPGVTKVEVVKIEKIWDKSKYVYVAHATVTKAVPPAEVAGLKGVTLLIATSAYYDIGAAQPYQVLGSESNGEYRGINLPFPSNEDLQKWGTQFGKESPEQFFLQGNSILGIEQINVTKPNCTWLHPLKLQYEANSIYVERLTTETVQKLQGRCEIELHRKSLTDPWFLGKAQMMTNESRYIGNPIHVSDAPQWHNAPSLTERKAAAESKKKIADAGVTGPPVFATAKELALHLIQKLHTLDKEKMTVYLGLLITNKLKNPGGGALDGNGTQMIDRAIEKAYAGWGKFKDQYCLVPAQIEEQGTRIAFYNKDASRYSYIYTVKENGSYFIDHIDMQKESTKEENDRFAAMACATTSNTNTATTTPSANAAVNYAVGEKVLVEERKKWYPATVLQIRPGEWFIHYDGYASSYDLWVGPARIKKQ